MATVALSLADYNAAKIPDSPSRSPSVTETPGPVGRYRVPPFRLRGPA